jgi:hypothetical protein
MSSCTTETGNFTQDRLTQINNYQYQHYHFLSTVLTRYSFILTYLIILLILRNADVMSENIFGWLFTPVLAYLAIDMMYSFYSFSRRGPVNFDTYIWTFNKKAASGDVTAMGTGTSSGGGTTAITATVQCTNAACCDSGMAWDSTIGKCRMIS